MLYPSSSQLHQISDAGTVLEKVVAKLVAGWSHQRKHLKEQREQ